MPPHAAILPAVGVVERVGLAEVLAVLGQYFGKDNVALISKHENIFVRFSDYMLYLFANLTLGG